jgi:hypothetical protein
MTEPVSDSVSAFLDAVQNRTASDDILPISARVRKEEAEALATAVPGQLFPRQGGIYFGQVAKDMDGNSLGEVFNIIAAPEDMTDETGNVVFTYNAAVERLARLENWHGFDGGHYLTDIELYAALKDGSYKGDWVIPTGDVLGGFGSSFTEVRGYLQLYSDKGAFAGTFQTEKSGLEGDLSHWYWSCTKWRYDDARGQIWSTAFTWWSDSEVRDKDKEQLRVRPVRLVPVPGIAPQGKTP